MNIENLNVHSNNALFIALVEDQGQWSRVTCDDVRQIPEKFKVHDVVVIDMTMKSLQPRLKHYEMSFGKHIELRMENNTHIDMDALGVPA